MMIGGGSRGKDRGQWDGLGLEEPGKRPAGEEIHVKRSIFIRSQNKIKFNLYFFQRLHSLRPRGEPQLELGVHVFVNYVELFLNSLDNLLSSTWE